MPELPEVETIVRGLNSVVLHKKITDFESFDQKVIQFRKEKVTESEITSVERRAKMIIFNLSNDQSILVHLKMTGQLIWEESPGSTDFNLKKRIAGGHPSPDWVAKLPNAYTRAVFHFEDMSVLFFNDLRRFAYMKIYPTAELKNEKELKKIGPEPFSKDFTVEYMMLRASKIPNRKIKQFITDQEIIAGVGNIYVDEALFMAKISPLRPVREISKTEWGKLRESIIRALELGIKYGGSSEDTYVNAFGEQGEMNQHVKVYRKTGEACPDGCGGKVERITLGGRGTHYCPNCQK